MMVIGRAMIFKSPAGELYFNPFSLKPIGLYGLQIHCEKDVYNDIVSAMGTSKYAFYEYKG